MRTTLSNILDQTQEAQIAEGLHQKFCVRPHPIETKDGVKALTRCGSRFHDQCPSCAEQTRGDWSRILRSGAVPSDDLPLEDLNGYRFMFLTLTHPSFGPVHYVPKHKKSPRKKCDCGIIHAHTDEDIRGTPVDPDDYDYDEQIIWNMATSKLWQNTRRKLDRIIPGFAFAVVREWQARGALHLHAMIRIPADTEITTPDYSGLVRTSDIVHAAKNTTAKSHGYPVHWGYQIVNGKEIGIQCDEVATFDSLHDREEVVAKIGYLAKTLGYTAKDWGDPFFGKVTSSNAPLVEHHRKLKEAALKVPCYRCMEVYADADEESNEIETLCTAPVHFNYGAASHTITVSRGSKNRDGWSLVELSRTVLKAQRAAWAQEHLATTSEEAQALRAEQQAMVLCWWNHKTFGNNPIGAKRLTDYSAALPELTPHVAEHNTSAFRFEYLGDHYREDGLMNAHVTVITDDDEPPSYDWLFEPVTRTDPTSGNTRDTCSGGGKEIKKNLNGTVTDTYELAR